MGTLITILFILTLILFSPLLVPLAVLSIPLVMFGPVAGAFVGWVLGLTFLGQWISEGAALFGLTLPADKLWLAGTFLGYVSGYVKGSSPNSSGDKSEKKTLLKWEKP